ncbi:MAG: NAD(P)H-hydrate epimerase, partial [Armatimonadota bacterium]|nr:NAD(P)H-hydrate epimerase [Armatimonadota bacterium]
MEAATATQSRSIDQRTIQQIGIPSTVLMENAGLAVVAAVERRLGCAAGRAVAILCGKGNNGGDGFVVARHLHLRGARISLFLAANLDHLTGDAALQARVAANVGLAIQEVRGAQEVDAALAGADVVVDALLGTGTRGRVEGLLAGLIDRINTARAPVVAVDVPSGLNADTGEVCGPCVRAAETVTFGVLKRGLVLYPGAAFAGVVTLAGISIPMAAIAAEGIDVLFMEPADVAALLPHRAPDAHKGSAGSVLVVAGSAGMTGAAALASLSALRVGAGLVRLAVPRSLNAILEAKATEVVTHPVSETDSSSFAPAGFLEALEAAGEVQCVATGPGLGRHPQTKAGLLQMLPRVGVPLVMD